MATVVYPKCMNDDIRTKKIEAMHPNYQIDLLPQKGSDVCRICAPGKRVIAHGNRFADIEG